MEMQEKEDKKKAKAVYVKGKNEGEKGEYLRIFMR